ncbi:MAG TPA: DNA polymerase IV [Oscillospiraceae bacterium]|nr:DNA polymerase IV [Oscillospiraceae bacterium]
MERAILHSDLNSFYASVEIMLNPRLRGKAIAVCGSTEDRHGIVLAKSELAKKAGVKTGMVNWEARALCKDLLVIPPQYEQYLKYSKLTQAIYNRYTDLIEPFGMDECWLDVTGSRGICGDGMTIAEDIRQTVREELGMTVSIGVSFNKIFAKLGSDMKKPDAITQITDSDFRKKVWPLPASDLIYCGHATTAKLAKYAIYSIGDLAITDPEFLRRLLGINGIALWHYANGTDRSRIMHRDFVSPVKSIGHGITCVCDLENDEEVWKVILELSQDIGHRLRVHELSAKGVQVSVRSNDLLGFQFQNKLPFKTQLPSEIGAAALHLFKDNYQWTTNVRAVTVRAINLVPKDESEQLSFFRDTARIDRRERLEDTVESIRSRFGNKAITYAVLIGDLKMPGDGRHLAKMPGLMYQ